MVLWDKKVEAEVRGIAKEKIIRTWIYRGGFREGKELTTQIRGAVPLACQNLRITSDVKEAAPLPS